MKTRQRLREQKNNPKQPKKTKLVGARSTATRRLRKGWWVGVVKIQRAVARYRLERAPIGARGSLERVAPPLGARSTATKQTLKAGGGYSPRPS